MFYKLLNEQGEYIKNDTQECVNLIYGEEIHTPLGKVTKEEVDKIQPNEIKSVNVRKNNTPKRIEIKKVK